MRVPIDWLHEYCRPELDTRRARRAAGDDRDRGRAGRAPRGRRAGELRRRHACSRPAATQTPTGCSVCLVDTGDGEPSQIVCGAPNVAAGQTVAVAKPGRGDARRHQAQGRQAPRPGLERDDPGRGRGRDRHRARRDHGPRRRRPASRARRWTACCRSPPTCSSSRSPPTAPTAWRSTASPARSTPRPARRWRRRRGRDDPGPRGRGRAGAAITVECPDLCPRFTARVFEDVKIGPSPWWLKARLMAAGQRPISNVVDITNYVMLLTGQPLHAFDLDRVAGAELTVRLAPRRRAGADARRPDADA